MKELYCFALFAAILQVSTAKMCYEECPSFDVIQSADINGCRRRSTFPNKQSFRCDGMKGPPCTVVRGDEVELDIKWKDDGHTNLTQSVVWEQGWVDLPWIGMETEICKYVNGGNGCPGIGTENGMSNLKFPIQILEQYPANSYGLRWELIDRQKDGDKIIMCFRFKIKIM